MELLPSFSENSMLALDFSIKSSLIVALSSLQTSQRNSATSSDTKSPYPQHTIHKLMENIPMAEFIHNHHPHSTTGKSPFYLMLGYEPQAIPNIIETAHLLALEEHFRNLDTSRKEALAAYKLTQQLMKNHIKSKFTPFEINNKVWLEARNLK